MSVIAFVPVPKDLSAVRTTVLFHLTRRQLLCFGAGLLAGLPAFFLLRGSLGAGTAAFVMILIMLPFFLLALYEKDGRHLEDVAASILSVKFLRPGVRPYRTDNYYRVLVRQDALDREVYQIVHSDPRTEKAR